MKRTLALALATLAFAACPSSSDDVCQDIGLCVTWSDSQIQACQSEADALESEADDGGCAGPFATYFACAASAYGCTGDTPTFVGCDGGRAALDSCLTAERAGNACGALADAEAACPAGDAGAVVPEPCTATNACAAQCYLTNVSAVCDPAPAELSAFVSCAGLCP